MRIEPIPDHLVMTVSMILALSGFNLFTAPATIVTRAVQQAENLFRAERA